MWDSLVPLAAAAFHFLPTLVLLWLAFFFGRTLRPGAVPLIEQVARIGKPDLSASLCRYTRGLTLVWALYFVAAALLTIATRIGFRQAGAGVAIASAIFFVGEHRLRPLLFPGEYFPGLIQQIRDTVQVWRPRRST